VIRLRATTKQLRQPATKVYYLIGVMLKLNSRRSGPKAKAIATNVFMFGIPFRGVEIDFYHRLTPGETFMVLVRF